MENDNPLETSRVPGIRDQLKAIHSGRRQQIWGTIGPFRDYSEF
ncbi:MAG: hypothetical protein ACLTT1_03420 [[Clostridium] scindens]